MSTAASWGRSFARWMNSTSGLTKNGDAMTGGFSLFSRVCVRLVG